MLRLRPTIVSLTPDEVTEVIHRQRFRRFLEAEEDVCVFFTPSESEAIYNMTRSKPPSACAVGREAGLQTDAGKSTSSPFRYNLPIRLASDRRAEEEWSLLPAPSHSGDSRLGADGEQLDSPSWTRRLCERPRRSSLPNATPASSIVDRDRAISWNGAPGNAATKPPRHDDRTGQRDVGVVDAGQASPPPAWFPEAESTCSTNRDSPKPESSLQVHDSQHLGPRGRTVVGLKAVPGPSTPRRTSSLGSPANATTSSIPSRQASPAALDGSDSFRLLEGSHAQASLATASIRRSSGRIRVYNDLLPASSQPQTPQHLPNARHQSRLQGSYTAPARRTSPRAPWTPTPSRSRRGQGHRRRPSPRGLQTPGFVGLFGGAENREDEVVVEEITGGRAREDDESA